MTAGVMAAFRVLKYCGGCFLFCSRRAFERAGGWDETVYAGEEILMARALKRHGRFVVLKEKVQTSGRKLRTHGLGDLMKLLGRMAITGGRATRRREGLEIWYGPRREDPGGPGRAGTKLPP